MSFRIQPSQRALDSLEKNIESARAQEQQDMEWQAENREREAHKDMVNRAGELAVSRQSSRSIDKEHRIYKSGWVDYPAGETLDHTVQLQLRRYDAITRRLMGIMIKQHFHYAKLFLRCKSTYPNEYGDEEAIALFQPYTAHGPLVSMGDTDTEKPEDYWYIIEPDSEEWLELDRVLKVFEKLPPTTGA